jgi:hypothetical protein
MVEFRATYPTQDNGGTDTVCVVCIATLQARSTTRRRRRRKKLNQNLERRKSAKNLNGVLSRNPHSIARNIQQANYSFTSVQMEKQIKFGKYFRSFTSKSFITSSILSKTTTLEYKGYNIT